MAVVTYDPKEYSITYGGRSLSGFEDGTFITVRRNNDMFAMKVGADGKGVRSKSNDRSGQVEIVLSQGSADNEFLSELAISDELANGGIRPFGMKDSSGSDLYASGGVWVKKMPDAPYAKEAGSRTWLLETDELEMFVGKNAQNNA